MFGIKNFNSSKLASKMIASFVTCDKDQKVVGENGIKLLNTSEGKNVYHPY